MTQQTEAQRLADELDTGDFDVMTNYQAAALLLRQDELLEQAFEALETCWSVGLTEANWKQVEEALAAIRAHREAK